MEKKANMVLLKKHIKISFDEISKGIYKSPAYFHEMLLLCGAIAYNYIIMP